MRTVRVTFLFCGEVFVADVRVDSSYFNKDGTLNETRLCNRLEAQPKVCDMTLIEQFRP